MATADPVTVLNAMAPSTYFRGNGSLDTNLAALEKYFGPAQSAPIIDPYQNSSIVAMNLDQYYKSDNLVLSSRITNYIAANKGGYLTTLVLPLFSVTQLRWIFSIERANPAIARLVPYEGTSALLTSKIQQFQGHTERRGIMAKMEGDFYQSKNGDEIFQRQLEHIRSTVRTTFDWQVATEIDHCKDHYQEWIRQQPIMKVNPKVVMDFETKHFGCMHRCYDVSGFGQLVAELERSARTYDADPMTAALVPSNFMWMFKDLKKINPQYEIIAKDGTIKTLTIPDALAQLEGDPPKTIIPLQTIQVGNEIGEYNPFKHVAQIGQYYVMHARQGRGGFSNYKTVDLAIAVHHEEKDDYGFIKPTTALASCNRWNTTTGELRPEHQMLADDLNAGGPSSAKWATADGSLDPFIFRNPMNKNYYVTKMFGEMEPKFLTPAIITYITETIANGFSDSDLDMPAVDKALADLRNLIIASHNEPGTQTYWRKFSEKNGVYAARPAAPAAVENLPMTLTSVNAYKGFDIPTEDDDPNCLQGMGDVPPGINTKGMLDTLAHTCKHSKKWGKAAKIAMKGCLALNTLQVILKCRFPRNFLNSLECLPPTQQSLLRNARDGEVMQWGLFNIAYGVAYPAFIKLAPQPEARGRVGQTALSLLMAYNITAAKMASLMDICMTSDPAPLYGQPKNPVIQALESIIPIAPLTETAMATIASLPGMVKDVLSIAKTRVDVLVGNELGLLADDQQIRIKHDMARLITRLYFNDLIIAANSLHAQTRGQAWTGFPQTLQTLAAASPRNLEKYIAHGLVLREGDTASPRAANALREEVTAVSGIIVEALKPVIPDPRTDRPYPLSEKMRFISSQMTTTLSYYELRGRPQQQYADIRTLFVDNADPNNIPGVMFRLAVIFRLANNIMAPPGIGDGSWSIAPVVAEGAALNKYITKDAQRAASAIISALRAKTAALPDDLFLSAVLNYTNATELVPLQLSNTSDPIHTDSPLEMDGGLNISFMQDLTHETRQSLWNAVQTGSITGATTIGDLKAMVGTLSGTLTRADWLALPVYVAPFGCPLALADKFMRDPLYYGDMPLVFPPDLNSDCSLPALPATQGFVFSDPGYQLVEEIRSSINRTANGALMDFGNSAPDVYSSTAAYAMYKPVGGGPVSGLMGSRIPATVKRGLSAIVRMQTLHNNTFGLSESRRCMALTFAVADVTWFNVVAMMDNNVLLPWSILIARAFMTMETHDIVIMHTGKDTGMTFIGQDTCKIGMAVENNTWIIHYLFHSKPFIYRHENIIKMRDAVITKVLCGFNIEPILSDADTPVTGRLENCKDIICMLGGFYDARIEDPGDPNTNAKVLPNPLSITSDYAQLPLTVRLPEFARPFGPAFYYAKVFPETFVRSRLDVGAVNRPVMAGYPVNTICYLGEFYYQDPATGQWTAHTHNTGHLSITATMPGSSQVRKGAAPTYAREYIPRIGLVP